MQRQAGRQATTRRRDRTALLVVTCAVLVLLACAGAYRALLGPAPASMIGGPFLLAGADGQPRGTSSFRGRYMLIFFGYTGCTDICPRTLTEMSEALDRVDPQAARIQPLFITVDPKHDTPDQLRRYTAGFSPHLLGLTGTADQLHAVQRTFHVVVQPDKTGNPTDLDHSAVLYLLGPAGNFIAPIPADADRSVMQAALLHYVGASGAG